MTRTGIIVMGMHRSGTSMVTGLLKIIGVHLGPDIELMGPGKDNPTGFFEHKRLSGVNVRVFERLGGDWQNLPKFGKDWEKSDSVNDLKMEGAQIMARLFSYAPIWAFKDPRNSFTYPFWCDAARCPTKALIVMRNPVDVARSLAARQGFPLSKGIELWHEYTKSALSVTKHVPRLIMVYEDFLAQFEVGLASLSAFVGIKDWRTKLKEARAFAREDLRHHRATPEEIKLRMPDL